MMFEPAKDNNSILKIDGGGQQTSSRRNNGKMQTEAKFSESFIGPLLLTPVKEEIFGVTQSSPKLKEHEKLLPMMSPQNRHP